MPTIALFYTRNACLLFNRVALCAICTGLDSKYNYTGGHCFTNNQPIQQKLNKISTF